MTGPSISDIRKDPFLDPFLCHKKTVQTSETNALTGGY